jgi:hypothetical protein
MHGVQEPGWFTVAAEWTAKKSSLDYRQGQGICLFKLVQTGHGGHTADNVVGTEGKAAAA